jgi:hypothetical protein
MKIQSAFVRNALLAVALTLGASTAARADSYIVPFLGYDFGGDSGCPEIRNCEDKKLNLGVTIGSAGGFLGLEEELGYAKNFFGEVPGAQNSVMTLMTNLVIGPKIAFIRPYFTVGAGLIRSHVDFTVANLLSTTNNAFGWNSGVGVMLTFGHVGVRGDLRHFHSFQNQLLGVSLSKSKLDFARASAGLVLAF